jgi:DNA-directed RNA polymerase subunit N (RpoN/RPB10)
MSQLENEMQYNRIPIFNGKDFPIWKKKILAYLGVRGLTELRQLSEEEKTEAKNKAEVDRSYKVYSILLLALTNEQTRFIMDVSDGDGNGIWENLLQRFERKTTASISHTSTMLGQSQMKEDELFDSYLARIKELQIKLIEMGEVPSKNELRYILLKGLPESYGNLVSALDVNGDKEFDEVCNYIRDYQEKQQIRKRTELIEEETAAANYAESRSNGYRKNGHYNKSTTEIKCFTCGKPGHRAFDCYKNKDKKKCKCCKNIGHTEEQCRYNEGTDEKETSLYVNEDSW